MFIHGPEAREQPPKDLILKEAKHGKISTRVPVMVRMKATEPLLPTHHVDQIVLEKVHQVHMMSVIPTMRVGQSVDQVQEGNMILPDFAKVD